MSDPKPCEAIIGEFVWGVYRCGQPSTSDAIDAVWGTIHRVCPEHAPAEAVTP